MVESTTWNPSLSARDEPWLVQYQGFHRVFTMPFTRHLGGHAITSIDSIQLLDSEELDFSNPAISGKLVQVKIDGRTAAAGTYRIKFVVRSDGGSLVPLVGRLSVLP